MRVRGESLLVVFDALTGESLWLGIGARVLETASRKTTRRCVVNFSGCLCRPGRGQSTKMRGEGKDLKLRGEYIYFFFYQPNSIQRSV